MNPSATTRSDQKPATADPGEKAVLAAIDTMSEPDRTMSERLHAIITSSAPVLRPRLWYGMPAYAMDGKVICFFQPREKFKVRYMTLGFSDKAHLDEGRMWPTSYALTDLTPAEEERIAALVKLAVSCKEVPVPGCGLLCPDASAWADL